jgi:hypothetical protein
MTYLLTFLLAITINCGSVSDYSVPAIATGPAGTWTGDSICTVKSSPCRDEHCIYRITEPDTAGKFKIQADKVVDGKPEFMGTLDCTYDEKASSVECKMNNGVWWFTIAGDKMEGTLKLTDGTLYRRISVTKDKN